MALPDSTTERARQGIASEAAAACRDDCFTRLDQPYLIALVRPENTPSRGVAERIGMTPGSVRVNLHRGLALLKERLG